MRILRPQEAALGRTHCRTGALGGCDGGGSGLSAAETEGHFFPGHPREPIRRGGDQKEIIGIRGEEVKEILGVTARYLSKFLWLEQNASEDKFKD